MHDELANRVAPGSRHYEDYQDSEAFQGLLDEPRRALWGDRPHPTGTFLDKLAEMGQDPVNLLWPLLMLGGRKMMGRGFQQPTTLGKFARASGGSLLAALGLAGGAGWNAIARDEPDELSHDELLKRDLGTGP